MKVKEWCIALDNVSSYIDSVLGLRYKFLKGERATKEKVFSMIPSMTEEEYERYFRPATEEEINGEFEWDGEQYVLEKAKRMKIDLEKLICSLFKQADKTGYKLRLSNFIKALKEQGLEYNDGKLTQIESEPETAPANEGECLQAPPSVFFAYSLPQGFPPLLKEEHYRLVSIDLANLVEYIRKRLSSLQEHEVDPFLEDTQNLLLKKAEHLQERVQLMREFHSYYNIPKPEK